MKYGVKITTEGGDTRILEETVQGSLSQREQGAHALGRQVEQAILELSLQEDQPVTPRPCCCGRPMNKKRLRHRTLLTPTGPVQWDRRVFLCPLCKQMVIPADAALGIPAGELSPRLAERALDFVQVQSYEQARAMLERTYGVHVAVRTLETLAARVATPALAFETSPLPAAGSQEPVKRLYVGCDGVMVCSNERGGDGKLQWREVKVGCCYWRDPDPRLHKRVLGRREQAESFGARLRAWAERYGLSEATEVIFVGDGAEWIWNIAARHFNDGRTTWILDWYHLVEHLWEAARTMFPDQPAAQRDQVSQWKAVLRKAGGHRLWRRLCEQLESESGSPHREALDKLRGYMQPRLDQTDYPSYRARGLDIGSGIVEATVKQLAVMRAKGPGMHWGDDGIEAVLSLRAIVLNGEWAVFWKREPLRRAA